jgi:hypothetical protein
VNAAPPDYAIFFPACQRFDAAVVRLHISERPEHEALAAPPPQTLLTLILAVNTRLS